MPTLVVALGGNALIKQGQKGTAEQQLKNLDCVTEQIVNLYNRGHKIVLTHGNGPQVGNILLRQEKARDYAPPQPLHVCVAQSQGMIGYFIQEALYNKLKAKGFSIPVVTILTQVLVDKKDPAFKNPNKPIGPTYPTRERMTKSWKFNRTLKGYRRVVASPKPRAIIEAKEIKRVSRGAIVIACGGGGIPVVKDHGLRGIDAVIDKDLTAARLAEAVGAKTLAILTDVDFVYLHYKKPREKPLKKVTVQELRIFQRQGHFLPGSMGPKIQAAQRFLARGGKEVVITRLEKLEQGIDGDWGTRIVRA